MRRRISFLLHSSLVITLTLMPWIHTSEDHLALKRHELSQGESTPVCHYELCCLQLSSFCVLWRLCVFHICSDVSLLWWFHIAGFHCPEDLDCLKVHVSMYIVCVCVWRAEANVRNLPYSLRQGFSNEPEACPYGQSNQLVLDSSISASVHMAGHPHHVSACWEAKPWSSSLSGCVVFMEPSPSLYF